MHDAFMGDVPTGTDAQPTGESFSSKLLGRPHTREDLLLITHRMKNRKNFRGTHFDHERQESQFPTLPPGAENPSGWRRRRWGERGERLLHGGHRGAGVGHGVYWARETNLSPRGSDNRGNFTPQGRGDNGTEKRQRQRQGQPTKSIYG
jgi:hypothetical protein